MKIAQFAFLLLLGVSGNYIEAQKLFVQNDRISEAFNIGFLAMAPKIMCSDSIETVFITLTNMTRPIEVMVQILDGGPEDVITETPIRLVGTPCACLQIRVPPIKAGRRMMTLQLLARRTAVQCDDFEVVVAKKIFIDSCDAETFIESDKPVYIAGQKVQFRVLTLKTDLRPDTTPVSKIWIEDPNKAIMTEWKDVTGEDGLIEFDFQLSKEPPLGRWKIRLIHHGRPYDLPFQVEKYDVPRFEILIEKPPFLIVDTQTMSLKICARYPSGQAVPGSIEVRVAVINLGATIAPSTSKRRRVLTFKEEDTGLNGCYEAVVDLEQLKLCSEDYFFEQARLQLTVKYTDTNTGITVIETDKDMLVSKTPYRVTFDASPVFKPGLPYHGRLVVRYPDQTPAARKAITLLALGNEHGVYKETLTSDDDGIINFLLPEIMYEIKTLSLEAQGIYQIATACGHPNDFSMAAPKASLTMQKQYSPSGSFIQILPINNRVKINSLQTITIYFVTKKPEYEGINFHVMFMSRGNILRSTEVFIYPEDYNGYKHPGSYLPIPAYVHEPHTEKDIAEPHIGPIDTPVNLVKPDKITVTHRKFKITAAMTPLTSVIVYYIRKDNEVVSEMIDFKVEEVFENEVKMKFVRNEETPRALTKLQIKASPGSLCAYGVVDMAIHMMGEENRITKKRVFNALARLQLSAEGGYADQGDKCGDIYKFSVRKRQQSGNGLIGSQLPNGMMELPGFAPELMDGSIAFMNMGIVYLTNLNVETRPCPTFSVGDEFKKPTSGATKSEDITSAADSVVDVPGKTLKIKSFFPKTWLWEIKRTSKDTGESDVTVVVPDRITTWIGRGFCTNTKHGAGVSDLFPLRVYQSFYIELVLPPSVIRGEKIPVTVLVYDYLQECMVVRLSLRKSDDFTASERHPERTVCTCPGMPGTAVFFIVPNVIGDVSVEVFGISLEDNIEDSACGDDPVDMFQVGLTDSAKKQVLIKARGIVVEQVFSSYFCPSDYSDGVYEERLLLRELPASFVPGTLSSIVTVSGDLIAPSLTNLDESLLRLPLISGEQNLLQFAPNVFILRYLKNTNQLTPQIKTKAVANMNVGYQRQETFRHKDGSYVVFRNDLEGSSWLTAYVIRVYAFASQFMSVDIVNLEASLKWLKSLQDVSSGCFQPTGRIIHRALRGTVRDDVTMTAYTLSAMLEAGVNRRDPSIIKGLECLNLALNGIGDPYTAALMAYTFALAEEPCLAKAIQLLNPLGIIELSTIHWETGREDIPAEDNPYLHRKAAAQDIEMTAYVLLSYSISRESTYVVESGDKIARWIVNQLNGIGGFASTQDTMVALQALAEYASVDRIVRGHTDIDVNVHFVCDKKPLTIGVTEDNRLELQRIPVPIIPVNIHLTATGEACAMTQVMARYNVIPEEPFNPKFILTYTSTPVNNDCHHQQMKICVTYAGDELASNLAVINVRLVSGYTADEDSIADLEVRGLAKGLNKVETDYNTVDIFVDKFILKPKCFIVRAKKEFDIRDTKKGIITVYDYYEPARTVSTLFKFGCGHEAENEENDPKKGLCPDIELAGSGIEVCTNMCQDDSGCDGSQKCCSNGCGRMCMIPTAVEKAAAEPKFGHCPLVEARANRRICENKCESDDDCDGIKKCCVDSNGCNACDMPSELKVCPGCFSQLPTVAAYILCKYDYVVSGKLLDLGRLEIKRDLKTNNRIKGIPNVKINVHDKCDCPVLKTRSLVMLVFNNRDLDLEAKTLTLEGNSMVLRLTVVLKENIKDLHEMCAKTSVTAP